MKYMEMRDRLTLVEAFLRDTEAILRDIELHSAHVHSPSYDEDYSFFVVSPPPDARRALQQLAERYGTAELPIEIERKDLPQRPQVNFYLTVPYAGHTVQLWMATSPVTRDAERADGEEYAVVLADGTEAWTNLAALPEGARWRTVLDEPAAVAS